MNEQNFDFCLDCLDELMQHGAFIACFYQELCMAYAVKKGPIKLWTPMPAMISFLEPKGFLVSHEAGCEENCAVYIKPAVEGERFCKGHSSKTTRAPSRAPLQAKPEDLNNS